MILAQGTSLTDWYWWPLIPVVTGAAVSVIVAWAVYVVGRRNAADKEAREVHWAVTTGPGGQARAVFSRADFDWWWNRVPLKPRTSSANEDLYGQFYVLGSSLDQLVLALSGYNPKRGRRSEKVRRLLGWHAGMHIAWTIWFLGAVEGAHEPDGAHEPAAVEGAHEPAATDPNVDVRARVEDAISRIGDHRVEFANVEQKSDAVRSPMTIKDYAERELARWLVPALKVKTDDTVTKEAKKVKTLAEKLGFTLNFDDATPQTGSGDQCASAGGSQDVQT